MPLVVLGLLAVALGQVVLLPLFAQELRPVVNEHRRELVAQHRAALRLDGHGEAAALRRARADQYARQVGTASFVVHQITWLWRRPLRAAACSIAWLLACWLPLLWARGPALPVVRAYARARHGDARATVEREGRRTEAQVQQLLARHRRGTP